MQMDQAAGRVVEGFTGPSNRAQRRKNVTSPPGAACQTHSNSGLERPHRPAHEGRGPQDHEQRQGEHRRALPPVHLVPQGSASASALPHDETLVTFATKCPFDIRLTLAF